ATTPSRRLRSYKQKRPDASASIIGDRDTSARDAALALWGDNPAAVFGDLTIAPPSGNKLTLVYRKPGDAGSHGAMGGIRRDTEGVYLLGSWPCSLGGRSSVLETGS